MPLALAFVLSCESRPVAANNVLSRFFCDAAMSVRAWRVSKKGRNAGIFRRAGAVISDEVMKENSRRRNGVRYSARRRRDTLDALTRNIDLTCFRRPISPDAYWRSGCPAPAASSSWCVGEAKSWPCARAAVHRAGGVDAAHRAHAVASSRRLGIACIAAAMRAYKCRRY